MLISLTKILLFLVIVAALALGVAYLIDGQNLILGNVQAIVAGTEYTLTPLQAVLALFFFSILVWIGLKIFGLLIAVLKFINGDETAVTRYFFRNRERKGFQALSEGLMALASGEGRLAMAKAAKAERYLHRPDLTDLVTAQAAEMTGDAKKAEEVYKRLLKDDGTRFVGVRGLMKQKLAKGDTDTALKLAERAFAIKPKHEEVQNTLLQLQAQTADWDGARKTLAAKLKHGSLPRDVYRRRDAVLALSEARAITDDEQSAKAAEAAIAANKASPDLIPAAAMAARAYVAESRPRNAVRVIKKAWEVLPHPDLAAAFAAIEPEETPAARLKRFEPLMRLKPDHRETKLLKAELNLAAEDFPEAKRAMGTLADEDPDARVLAIMAAIARGEGASEDVVRGWLARALTAPRGPQWVCDNCNNVQAEWGPVCSNCSGFDTLSWTTPPQNDGVLPAGADMLPLIVGAIEDKTGTEITEAEVVDVPQGMIDVTDAATETVDAEIVDGTEKVKEDAK